MFKGEFKIHRGDVIKHMQEMPKECIDHAVFSPPFPSVFAYQPDPGDIGNSEDLANEAPLHFTFFFRGLLRVMKPGRAVICHCTQIPLLKRSGKEGLFDFRGLLIRIAQRCGFVYEYDWVVRVNPQSQAIRTHSHELQFAGLEKDRANCRGALGMYLIKFQTPGENAKRVNAPGQVTRNDWIDWAEVCWDIPETDTLNVEEARSPEDTRHICVARDSLVLTKSKGYIPIQNVEIGDSVLTHMGRWRPVVARRCNGVKPTVQVKANGVPMLCVTPDHRIWARPAGNDIYRHRRHAKNNDPVWMEASQLKSQYVNLKLPPVEECGYSLHDLWIAGRWLGDGHYDSRGGLHISCSFAEQDELIARLGSRAGFVHSASAVQIRIRDDGGVIRQMLSECGKGATDKRLAGWMLTLGGEQAKAILDGYLSADGSFNKRYQRWMLSSVSRPLALGIAILAQRCYGVSCSVYAGRPARIGTILGRTVNMKADWIGSIPPKNKHAFIVDDGAWKKVRDVVNVGDSEVWDLQVADDESFTVEGCVVHNCPLQLGIYERCIRLYTDPGELVFDPFAGIGSGGFVALGGESPKTHRFITEPRRFYGCEMKDEYYRVAVKNCTKAIKQREIRQKDLFSGLEAS